MRRAAVIVCAALALSACGGGGAPANPAIAQIKAAYTNFFTTSTSAAAHAALMENGATFEPVIEKFLANPMASGVSATVSSVTMQGTKRAKVVYTVKVGGFSVSNQVGYAVLQDGKWKVADATLCALVALMGSTPAACKS